MNAYIYLNHNFYLVQASFYTLISFTLSKWNKSREWGEYEYTLLTYYSYSTHTLLTHSSFSKYILLIHSSYATYILLILYSHSIYTVLYYTHTLLIFYTSYSYCTYINTCIIHFINIQHILWAYTAHILLILF